MSKILIVEDDPMLVEIYDKKLSDAGYEVKIVTSGAAVKDEAAVFRPEIILLDVVLPDMDGFEVLESIKKDAELKSIPIYVFSNLSAKEDLERAMRLGATGFLTKSNLTPSQLSDEIGKILGKTTVAVDNKNQPIAVPQPEIEKNEPNGHKILIIEDEDIFIDMFSDKLKQEGFEVVAAKNGKWGIKEAGLGGFSCILLDVMMPAMNGFEAIKELRANENTKNIPVIILSNSALESEVKTAVSLGANAYHVKTQITPGEIAQEVKELISQAKS